MDKSKVLFQAFFRKVTWKFLAETIKTLQTSWLIFKGRDEQVASGKPLFKASGAELLLLLLQPRAIWGCVAEAMWCSAVLSERALKFVLVLLNSKFLEVRLKFKKHASHLYRNSIIESLYLHNLVLFLELT